MDPSLHTNNGKYISGNWKPSKSVRPELFFLSSKAIRDSESFVENNTATGDNHIWVIDETSSSDSSDTSWTSPPQQRGNPSRLNILEHNVNSNPTRQGTNSLNHDTKKNSCTKNVRKPLFSIFSNFVSDKKQMGNKLTDSTQPSSSQHISDTQKTRRLSLKKSGQMGDSQKMLSQDDYLSQTEASNDTDSERSTGIVERTNDKTFTHSSSTTCKLINGKEGIPNTRLSTSLKHADTSIEFVSDASVTSEDESPKVRSRAETYACVNSLTGDNEKKDKPSDKKLPRSHVLSANQRNMECQPLSHSKKSHEGDLSSEDSQDSISIFISHTQPGDKILEKEMVPNVCQHLSRQEKRFLKNDAREIDSQMSGGSETMAETLDFGTSVVDGENFLQVPSSKNVKVFSEQDRKKAGSDIQSIARDVLKNADKNFLSQALETAVNSLSQKQSSDKDNSQDTILISSSGEEDDDDTQRSDRETQLINRKSSSLLPSLSSASTIRYSFLADAAGSEIVPNSLSSKDSSPTTSLLPMSTFRQNIPELTKANSYSQISQEISYQGNLAGRKCERTTDNSDLAMLKPTSTSSSLSVPSLEMRLLSSTSSMPYSVPSLEMRLLSSTSSMPSLQKRPSVFIINDGDTDNEDHSPPILSQYFPVSSTALIDRFTPAKSSSPKAVPVKLKDSTSFSDSAANSSGSTEALMFSESFDQPNEALGTSVSNKVTDILDMLNSGDEDDEDSTRSFFKNATHITAEPNTDYTIRSYSVEQHGRKEPLDKHTLRVFNEGQGTAELIPEKFALKVENSATASCKENISFYSDINEEPLVLSSDDEEFFMSQKFNEEKESSLAGKNSNPDTESDNEVDHTDLKRGGGVKEEFLDGDLDNDEDSGSECNLLTNDMDSLIRRENTSYIQSSSNKVDERCEEEDVVNETIIWDDDDELDDLYLAHTQVDYVIHIDDEPIEGQEGWDKNETVCVDNKKVVDKDNALINLNQEDYFKEDSNAVDSFSEEAELLVHDTKGMGNKRDASCLQNKIRDLKSAEVETFNEIDDHSSFSDDDLNNFYCAATQADFIGNVEDTSVEASRKYFNKNQVENRLLNKPVDKEVSEHTNETVGQRDLENDCVFNRETNGFDQSARQILSLKQGEKLARLPSSVQAESQRHFLHTDLQPELLALDIAKGNKSTLVHDNYGSYCGAAQRNSCSQSQREIHKLGHVAEESRPEYGNPAVRETQLNPYNASTVADVPAEDTQDPFFAETLEYRMTEDTQDPFDIATEKLGNKSSVKQNLWDRLRFRSLNAKDREEMDSEMTKCITSDVESTIVPRNVRHEKQLVVSASDSSEDLFGDEKDHISAQLLECTRINFLERDKKQRHEVVTKQKKQLNQETFNFFLAETQQNHGDFRNKGTDVYSLSTQKFGSGRIKDDSAGIETLCNSSSTHGGSDLRSSFLKSEEVFVTKMTNEINFEQSTIQPSQSKLVLKGVYSQETVIDSSSSDEAGDVSNLDLSIYSQQTQVDSCTDHEEDGDNLYKGQTQVESLAGADAATSVVSAHGHGPYSLETQVDSVFTDPTTMLDRIASFSGSTLKDEGDTYLQISVPEPPVKVECRPFMQELYERPLKLEVNMSPQHESDLYLAQTQMISSHGQDQRSISVEDFKIKVELEQDVAAQDEAYLCSTQKDSLSVADVSCAAVYHEKSYSPKVGVPGSEGKRSRENNLANMDALLTHDNHLWIENMLQTMKSQGPLPLAQSFDQSSSQSSGNSCKQSQVLQEQNSVSATLEKSPYFETFNKDAVTEHREQASNHEALATNSVKPISEPLESTSGSEIQCKAPKQIYKKTESLAPENLQNDLERVQNNSVVSSFSKNKYFFNADQSFKHSIKSRKSQNYKRKSADNFFKTFDRFETTDNNSTNNNSTNKCSTGENSCAKNDMSVMIPTDKHTSTQKHQVESYHEIPAKRKCLDSFNSSKNSSKVNCQPSSQKRKEMCAKHKGSEPISKRRKTAPASAVASHSSWIKVTKADRAEKSRTRPWKEKSEKIKKPKGESRKEGKLKGEARTEDKMNCLVKSAKQQLEERRLLKHILPVCDQLEPVSTSNRIVEDVEMPSTQEMMNLGLPILSATLPVSKKHLASGVPSQGRLASEEETSALAEPILDHNSALVLPKIQSKKVVLPPVPLFDTPTSCTTKQFQGSAKIFTPLDLEKSCCTSESTEAVAYPVVNFPKHDLATLAEIQTNPVATNSETLASSNLMAASCVGVASSANSFTDPRCTGLDSEIQAGVDETWTVQAHSSTPATNAQIVDMYALGDNVANLSSMQNKTAEKSSSLTPLPAATQVDTLQPSAIIVVTPQPSTEAQPVQSEMPIGPISKDAMNIPGSSPHMISSPSSHYFLKETNTCSAKKNSTVLPSPKQYEALPIQKGILKSRVISSPQPSKMNASVRVNFADPNKENVAHPQREVRLPQAELLPMKKAAKPLPEAKLYFLSVVLYWNPLWLEERERNQSLPELLGSHKKVADECCQLRMFYSEFHEYVHLTIKLLLLECWESIYRDWKMSRCYPPVQLQVHCMAPPTHPYKEQEGRGLVQFVVAGLLMQSERKKVPGVGDLVILDMWGAQKRQQSYDQPCWYQQFAVVKAVVLQMDKVRQFIETYPIFKDCAAFKDRNPLVFKLTLEMKYKGIVITPSKLHTIQVISSIKTMERQVDALVHLPENSLCSHLLKPSYGPVFTHHRLEPDTNLSSKLNKEQATVVMTISQEVARNPSSQKIFLLQGPPGTGKSHTILALIHQILVRAKFKERVCLAAPSNAAVDEIARRIINFSNQLTTRGLQCISLVRVGNRHKVHREVQTRMWEVLADQRIKQDLPDSLKVELTSLEKEMTELDRALADPALSGEQKVIKMTKLKEVHKRILKMNAESAPPKKNSLKWYRAKCEVLDKAHIICGTLNSLGSEELQRVILRSEDHTWKRRPFGCLIIDEATQAIEVDCLIPLQYKMNKVVMVGDHEQLPATVLSQMASDKLLTRSLFERMDSCIRELISSKQSPLLMLTRQYRMHKEIVSLPNAFFYESRLVTDESVLRRRDILAPYLVFDILEGRESRQENNRSVSNEAEAYCTAELCEAVYEKMKNIGVICPYVEQQQTILKYLRDRNQNMLIEVTTVDGFQGQERDVIILSCVRAQSNPSGIGFLSDRKRMNVALTRARHALFVIGHFDTLKTDGLWGQLYKNAQERRLLVRVAKLADFARIARNEVFRIKC